MLYIYIAIHIKDIKDFVIWRDSSETELLTSKRIKKLKADLNQYTPSKEINIQSIGKSKKFLVERLIWVLTMLKLNICYL